MDASQCEVIQSILITSTFDSNFSLNALIMSEVRSRFFIFLCSLALQHFISMPVMAVKCI